MVLETLAGHTASDVVARVEAEVTFCGDLVWNDLFPNYMDASPIQLRESVTALIAKPSKVVVPGHGPMPSPDQLSLYSAGSPGAG